MVAVKIKLLVVSLALLLASCGVPEPIPTVPSEVVIVALPTHTPEPILTAMSTATSTATATPTAVPTQTSTPTPTATPDPTCPEAGSAAPFTYPADTTELQASILVYLNAGGQWQDLFALLDELEIEHDWVQADMNGDGVMETAVYTLISDKDHMPYHTWWLLQCNSEKYSTIHQTWGNWVYPDYFLVDDLNNDGRSEIIVAKRFAGSACNLEPLVWIWQSDEIIQFSLAFLDLELGAPQTTR